MLTRGITFRMPSEPDVKLWRLLQLSGNADNCLGQKWPDRNKTWPIMPLFIQETIWVKSAISFTESIYFFHWLTIWPKNHRLAELYRVWLFFCRMDKSLVSFFAFWRLIKQFRNIAAYSFWNASQYFDRGIPINVLRKSDWSNAHTVGNFFGC